VPLDPASWQVLQRCVASRDVQRTANPHVIVTKCLVAACLHCLYESRPGRCGVRPRLLRCTRLANLVNTLDPKPAAAFGMNPEAVMIHLADHVDAGQMP
jgi:hypothetical protein